MLPSFSKMPLPGCSATTGEFYALNDDQAHNLGRDPITFEDVEAGRGREHPNATFRVRSRNPKPDGQGGLAYQYTYFKAAALWDWVKERGRARNPLTNEPIWREDWWELWARFEEERPHNARPSIQSNMPHWVRKLPLRDPNTPDPYTYYIYGMGGRSFPPPHVEILADLEDER